MRVPCTLMVTKTDKTQSTSHGEMQASKSLIIRITIDLDETLETVDHRSIDRKFRIIDKMIRRD